MKVNIESLQTPNNYRKAKGMSRAMAYKLIEQGKVDSIEIDGVKFIRIGAKQRRSTGK
jgi:hypothetical protein